MGHRVLLLTALVNAVIVLLTLPLRIHSDPQAAQVVPAPPPLPAGSVSLFDSIPPGAAINIGGIRAALASYGCAVTDAALDPDYGGDAYLRRADMPGPAVVVQDHAETLAVQCTETFYGLAGYADQDPKPGEAATTWLFNQHTDAPQAWIPAPEPDGWQVHNINGASDFELEFHGDSGGMLVYVDRGGPTPTPPPLTPGPTPTTVGTPVTPFPLGTPAAYLPLAGRLVGR